MTCFIKIRSKDCGINTICLSRGHKEILSLSSLNQLLSVLTKPNLRIKKCSMNTGRTLEQSFFLIATNFPKKLYLKIFVIFLENIKIRHVDDETFVHMSMNKVMQRRTNDLFYFSKVTVKIKNHVCENEFCH